MARETFLSGPVDLLLLAVIAAGPVHGYAVIDALRARSGGAIDLPEGTIYPALYRLETLGYLESSAERVSGRTRRTYRLTRAGRAAFSERRAGWRTLVRAVNAVLGAVKMPHRGPPAVEFVS